MFDWLIDYFMTHPSRMVSVGMTVFHVSSAALAVGAFVYLVTTTIGRLHSFGGVNTMATIRDFLPGVPTWWVPESFPAFSLYVAIAVAGLLVAHRGKRYERFLNS